MILNDVDAEYALSQMLTEIESKLDVLNIDEQNERIVGIKTAYVEIMELIQLWEKAELYGLDYNIEVKYPISTNLEELYYERKGKFS